MDDKEQGRPTLNKTLQEIVLVLDDDQGRKRLLGQPARLLITVPPAV
jgi:hypothetical protein